MDERIRIVVPPTDAVAFGVILRTMTRPAHHRNEFAATRLLKTWTALDLRDNGGAGTAQRDLSDLGYHALFCQ